MALVSSCTAFSYSHWNAFVNDEMKMIVGCKEQLIDKSTQDVKRKNVLGTSFRCALFLSRYLGWSSMHYFHGWTGRFYRHLREFTRICRNLNISRCKTNHLPFGLNRRKITSLHRFYLVPFRIIPFSSREILIRSFLSCDGCQSIVYRNCQSTSVKY